MRKLSVYFLVVLLTTILVAQAHANGYSPGGFGVEVSSPTSLGLDTAINKAKSELVNNMLKTAGSLMNSDQKEGKHGWRKERQDFSQAYQGFKNQVETVNQFINTGEGTESKIRLLSFIDVETRDDSDKWAYVKLNQQKLKRYMDEEVVVLQKELVALINSARKMEASNPAEAVHHYQRTYPIWDALNKVALLQTVTDSKQVATEARQNLVQRIVHTSGNVQTSYREVRQEVVRLQRDTAAPAVTVEAIASAIAKQLLAQRSQPPSGTVQVDLFTYENTQVQSPVSLALYQALTKELPRWKFLSLNTRGMKRIPLKLSGEIWKTEDAQFRVAASLNRGDTGKQLASANVSTPQAKYRGAQIIPANLQQAKNHNDNFADRTPTSRIITGDELTVDFWTNKGPESVSYEADEEMTVYCRVNQPSYVRLLYMLENGSYTVLYDNYRITQENVGRNVTIDTFVCAPPFGSEILMIQARAEKFPQLDTQEEDGYYYLKTRDPEKAFEILKEHGGIIKNLNVTTGPKMKRF